MPLSQHNLELSSKSEVAQQSLADKITGNLNPVDFARGLYTGAVEKPLEGLKQLAGTKASPESRESQSLAGAAGVMVGQIVDFSLLAVAGHSALKPVFKSAIDGITGTGAKMFLAGALDAGLFTVSEPNKSLLTSRVEAAVIGGTTFAIMGGAGKALEGANLFKSNKFIVASLKSALSGGAGGIVSAYGTALIQEGRLAKEDEVISSAAHFAAFGAGMHVIHAGIARGAESPVLKNAYYDAKWKISEGNLEARKIAYATLNDIGMRHPVKRLGDLVFGSVKIEALKVPITAENHPLALFEKELPLYVERIQAAEVKYNEGPRQERYERLQEINEIKAKFAEQLLTVWHGTAERPGLATYTDAELAGKYSLEHVAQVRKALASSMKRPGYNDLSPFEEKLSKFSPVDFDGDLVNFDLGSGMSTARERFFKYNERELVQKLSLNGEHHAISRSWETPLSWMPFLPSEKLANLFHCTTSRSLPSIFAEGKLLPARELRLRGIKQTTGESADENFGRRAISMTRDFGIAFRYHEAGPRVLNDYPVVFGISKAVTTKKAWSAGGLEPGEVLADKLRLGKSWLQNLGLAKPEVTHMYVPDGQVDVLNQTLKAHRIQGLKVVGFSDIDEPIWQ